MNIGKLENDVISKMRSSFTINGLAQCVCELVCNSLDANSTAVAVRVNLVTFKIQVADNGEGISKENMQFIGIRHMTNKCKRLGDIEKKLKTYGFRGEAIASIVELCGSVSISSRLKSSLDTYTVVLSKGSRSDVTATKSRESIGTTVTVLGWLSTVPIRQKRIMPAIDLEETKLQLEKLIIINPKTSLTLRNDVNGTLLLNSPKHADIINAFRHLHPEIDDCFTLLKVSKSKIAIELLMQKETTTSKSFQYIYVNKKPTKCPKLLKHVQKSLNSRSKQGVLYNNKKYPIYVMNIKCPPSWVDFLLDEVQFTCWDLILACVDRLLKAFYGEEEETNEMVKRKIEEKLTCGVSRLAGVVEASAFKRKVDNPQESDVKSKYLTPEKKLKGAFVSDKTLKVMRSQTTNGGNYQIEEDSEMKPRGSVKIKSIIKKRKPLDIKVRQVEREVESIREADGARDFDQRSVYSRLTNNEHRGKNLIMDMFLKSTQIYQQPTPPPIQQDSIPNSTIEESNFLLENNLQDNVKGINTTMSVSINIKKKRCKNIEQQLPVERGGVITRHKSMQTELVDKFDTFNLKPNYTLLINTVDHKQGYVFKRKSEEMDIDEAVEQFRPLKICHCNQQENIFDFRLNAGDRVAKNEESKKTIHPIAKLRTLTKTARIIKKRGIQSTQTKIEVSSPYFTKPVQFKQFQPKYKSTQKCINDIHAVDAQDCMAKVDQYAQKNNELQKHHSPEHQIHPHQYVQKNYFLNHQLPLKYNFPAHHASKHQHLAESNLQSCCVKCQCRHFQVEQACRNNCERIRDDLVEVAQPDVDHKQPDRHLKGGLRSGECEDLTSINCKINLEEDPAMEFYHKLIPCMPANLEREQDIDGVTPWGLRKCKCLHEVCKNNLEEQGVQADRLDKFLMMNLAPSDHQKHQIVQTRLGECRLSFKPEIFRNKFEKDLITDCAGINTNNPLLVDCTAPNALRGLIKLKEPRCTVFSPKSIKKHQDVEVGECRYMTHNHHCRNNSNTDFNLADHAGTNAKFPFNCQGKSDENCQNNLEKNCTKTNNSLFSNLLVKRQKHQDNKTEESNAATNTNTFLFSNPLANKDCLLDYMPPKVFRHQVEDVIKTKLPKPDKVCQNNTGNARVKTLFSNLMDSIPLNLERNHQRHQDIDLDEYIERDGTKVANHIPPNFYRGRQKHQEVDDCIQSKLEESNYQKLYRSNSEKGCIKAPLFTNLLTTAYTKTITPLFANPLIKNENGTNAPPNFYRVTQKHQHIDDLMESKLKEPKYQKLRRSNSEKSCTKAPLFSNHLATADTKTISPLFANPLIKNDSFQLKLHCSPLKPKENCVNDQHVANTSPLLFSNPLTQKENHFSNTPPNLGDVKPAAQNCSARFKAPSIFDGEKSLLSDAPWYTPNVEENMFDFKLSGLPNNIFNKDEHKSSNLEVSLVNTDERRKLVLQELQQIDETCCSRIKVDSQNEWVKRLNERGEKFFVNQRTGMVSARTPALTQNNFEFDERLMDFVPKGMSPVLKGHKAVDKSLSQNAKDKLQKLTLEGYDDELMVVKWQYFVGEDRKMFFESIYKDKSRQFESVIPKVHDHDIKVRKGLVEFDKDMFGSLEVIGQLDKKFIVVLERSKNLLILFDQHAVHERIRVEQFIKEYKGLKAPCSDKLTLFVPKTDLTLLQQHSSYLQTLGLELTCFSNGVHITHVPLCIKEKFGDQMLFEDLNKIVNLLIKDTLTFLKETRGSNVNLMPRIIQNVINLKACRGAIKFGDALSVSQCNELLKDLSRCQLPFQCAHGRPTLTPILNLNKISTKDKR